MTWPGGVRRGGDWWDGARTSRDDAGRRTSRGEPIEALREESLPYRDARGRRQTMTARVTDDDPITDPFYRTRLVVDADTLDEYVQKRVHSGGPRRPTAATSRSTDAVDAIDNEVQIGLHLIDAFGDRAYPRELSKLVGYYADDVSPEPFVLLAERGRPVERFAGRLLLDQTEQFPLSLLRALDLLESAGVVHRCLTTTTIRFDDRHIQVVDFRHAVLAGERCGPAPEPNWAAPEAVHGVDAASAKQDVYSAGMVFAHVAAAGSSSRSGRRDTSAAAPSGLLAAMTDYDPAARPRAGEVLAQLGGHNDGSAPTALRATALSSPDFVEGKHRFDAVLRRRSAFDDTTTTAPSGASGPLGRR